MEPGRRDTDNRERVFVEADHTPHSTRVVLKMCMPKRVREHHIRSTVRPTLIRGMEETPKVRLQTEYVEIVPAHFHRPDTDRVFTGVKSRLIDAVGCQAVEAAVPIA